MQQDTAALTPFIRSRLGISQSTTWGHSCFVSWPKHRAFLPIPVGVSLQALLCLVPPGDDKANLPQHWVKMTRWRDDEMTMPQAASEDSCAAALKQETAAASVEEAVASWPLGLLASWPIDTWKTKPLQGISWFESCSPGVYYCTAGRNSLLGIFRD